jgi:putative glutamine amidotransferase
MNRPRIGVTWCGHEHKQAFYDRAVTAAGGAVRRVMPEEALRVVDLVRELDGLLLTGGLDIEPSHYGQSRLEPPAVHDPVEVDVERDALELPLVGAALEYDLPVLGICRGIQVLNVACGGDLVQDVKLLGLDRGTHYQSRRSPALPSHEPGHSVRVASGTVLADIVGAGELGVNSFHHQVLGRLAPGFVIGAIAPDDVIEAIESPVHRFVLGVQWHPERMVEGDASHRGIFEALVLAAARR